VSVASNLLAEWEFGDCFGSVCDSRATKKQPTVYLVGGVARRGGGMASPIQSFWTIRQLLFRARQARSGSIIARSWLTTVVGTGLRRGISSSKSIPASVPHAQNCLMPSAASSNKRNRGRLSSRPCARKTWSGERKLLSAPSAACTIVSTPISYRIRIPILTAWPR
jgi:hypothetical protein